VIQLTGLHLDADFIMPTKIRMNSPWAPHLYDYGYGVIQQWAKGDGKYLAKKNAGNIDVPKGDAELMLVVYDKRVTLYVNGSRIVSAYDGLVKLGTLGFTISSGTNAGFGTRCQMTNVNLWIFD